MSTSHRSFRVYPPAPAWGPPQAAVCVSAFLCSSPQAAQAYLLRRSLTANCCKIPVSPRFFSQAAGESMLWNLEHLLCLLILWLCFSLSWSCFNFSSIFTACAEFCSLLGAFSQRCYHLGWWAQLCSAVSLPQYRAATLAAPCNQLLGNYTKYKCPNWIKYMILWCFFPCGTLACGYEYHHSICILLFYILSSHPYATTEGFFYCPLIGCKDSMRESPKSKTLTFKSKW